MKPLYLLWLVPLLLSGCARNLKPVGYFTVDPYARPLDNRIQEPLTVVLQNEVKDTLIVSGQSIKPMQVTAFRKTLSDNLQATLSKSFNQVAFKDQKQTTGLTLVIHRIRPYWGLKGTFTIVTGTTDTSFSMPLKFITANYQYDFTFYRNGEMIARVDGEAVSEEAFSYKSEIHPVFQNGLKVMCESINKKVLTDDTLSLLDN